MPPEITENTKISTDIKTLIALLVAIFVCFGFYYDLKTDISEAKNSPASQREYTMKDEIVRMTIDGLEEEIEEVKELIDELEEEVEGHHD